jgi:L-ascorbate metabolism protein UlaG (beta-lactamase superfamily)
MKKLNRRKFLKKISSASIGSLLVPPIFLRSSNREAAQSLPTEFKPLPESWRDDEITMAWIGHSTVLINFYGVKILTDPVLFERIGLFFLGMTFGPQRYSAPALEVDEIPKPDLILLSHAHMDHMDYQTLTSLTEKFPKEIDCITAFNTMDVISDLNWKTLREMDWGEELEYLGIKFSAYEVDHFGWRYPWERDRSKGFMNDGRSYNAYVLEKNGKRILFGGDTAFTELFKKVDVGSIDMAIMPIGAYNPWRKFHCNPEEALIMASEHLKAKYFVPIHCSTFKQGTEPIDEPLNWLNNSYKNYNIELGWNKIGQTFVLGF